MLKRPITYENPFTGDQVTEEHFFHISKADLVEMQIEEHDATYVKDGTELTGMQAKLQRISDAKDGKAIMAEIKDIIRRSYGKKQGERFVKNKEIADEFMSSEAFSQLLWELCTDSETASTFMSSIIPANLDQIAADVQKQAELLAAGREAQEKAKAAGTPVEVPAPGTLSKATGDVMEALTPETADRADQIANATPESPVTLTTAEVQAIDSDELKSGLATGRLKIG